MSNIITIRLKMCDEFRQNIVTFKGLFLKHLDEKPIQKTINYQISSVYDVIPPRFTTVEIWPKSTNLRCWNCDLQFTGYPKFVPMNPEYGANRSEIYEVRGNFCEWNCAVRYVMEKIPPYQQSDLNRLICVVSQKFTGRATQKIMPAPDKTRMHAYCGDHGISPAQYREEIAQLNSDYAIGNYKLDQLKY